MRVVEKKHVGNKCCGEGSGGKEVGVIRKKQIGEKHSGGGCDSRL